MFLKSIVKAIISTRSKLNSYQTTQLRSVFIVLAILTGFDAESRNIHFSGLWWEIKTESTGPGNMHWCDDNNAVWVDDNGDLHLRINYDNSINDWCQVEIKSLGFATYGDHRFQVISQLDTLDSDVVLGMFTYNDENAIDDVCPIIRNEHICEIDIEITNSFFDNSNRGNFIVQPSNTTESCAIDPNNTSCSFPISMPNGNYSSHRFQWFPSIIIFDSWHGHNSIPNNNNLIYTWDYTGQYIPPQDVDQRIHINLWICTESWCKRGDRTLTEPVEVVIRNYTGDLMPFEYELDVQVQGAGTVSGNGVNCTDNCTESFEVGTMIELEPAPAPGWLFSGWTGENCGGIRLFDDLLCTAVFVEQEMAPDLTVLNINVSNTMPNIDELFNIQAEVTNIGNQEGGDEYVLYYYSENPTISLSDSLLGDDTLFGLDPGEIRFRDDNVSIDDSPGFYWVGACITVDPNELNTSNNCSSGTQIELIDPGAPDLIIDVDSVSKTTLEVDEIFMMVVTAQNIGGSEAPAARVVYYYSTDATIEQTDLFMNDDQTSPMDPGESDSESSSVSIGQAGSFWVGTCIEILPGEEITDNNCSSPVAVSVVLPDLIFQGSFD